MPPLWAVQNNLDSPRDAERVTDACRSLGLDSLAFAGSRGSPPDVPATGPVLFYGSTHVLREVVRSGRWQPGAYFDDDAFRYSEYQKHYGARLLNASAELTTVQDFVERPLPRDRKFFLRPEGDLKEFPGDVLPFGKFADWGRRLLSTGQRDTAAMPIVVADPVDVEHEWRLFIVDGHVSAGAHYRFLGDLDLSPDLPTEVVEFGSEVAATWVPARAFVMDVASCSDDLFVVELNGFNSSGFYGADVPKIIADVSRGVD